ncbi:IucA/IucC family siderophore biosynthesis protein [Salinivibrio sp. ES.052]|uniref:IucA/IucC family protein n=1 Tax=Salinivibrio sp. ES.052 TaxID=1882823 RepID=UPI00092BD4CF|nr:IucA/IucC family protein [Salinivibrio sp. ES.052]SIO35675.1 aerobactin synthase [Salinivibrio sp. ES.052]
MQGNYWQAANQKLIAKAISELHFENAITVSHLEGRQFRLRLPDAEWLFSGTMSLWGMVMVESGSVSRGDNRQPELISLVMDLQAVIEMVPLHLGGFIEELQETLAEEQQHLAMLNAMPAEQLVVLSEIDRQPYLDAHPKFLANKGRLGWGQQERQQYAPEYGNAFALHYIAVHRECAQHGFRHGLEQVALLTDTLSLASYDALMTRLPADKHDDYLIMAVHPWQMQRYIYSQYASLLASGDMIDLGTSTEQWRPQQSIRTLSRADGQGKYDVKTALTILNTSCYRGVPGSFIAHGPVLSNWLSACVSQDALLSRLGMHVQQEVAGVYCPQPYQAQIDSCYKYHEMLGCVWRERAESLLPSHQRPMSMATLMQAGGDGVSCVEALITRTALTPNEWLQRLFDHVVVPLYHLLCQYGIGLVAHGQNITVVLEDDIPVGCMIKDFHGDLRFVDQPFPELDSLDKSVRAAIKHLPPHYLVHDLYTGHFVTTLRFISPWFVSLGVGEVEFYRQLGDTLHAYQQAHTQLSERFSLFDVLSETKEKICINRVRFNIGYDDSNERPLPMFGEPIANPLGM